MFAERERERERALCLNIYFQESISFNTSYAEYKTASTLPHNIIYHLEAT